MDNARLYRQISELLEITAQWADLRDAATHLQCDRRLAEAGLLECIDGDERQAAIDDDKRSLNGRMQDLFIEIRQVQLKVADEMDSRDG